jgi:hypothetical protein
VRAFQLVCSRYLNANITKGVATVDTIARFHSVGINYAPNLLISTQITIGHSQVEHETSHGSMSRTRWALGADAGEGLTVNGHKFGSEDEGAPMLVSWIVITPPLSYMILFSARWSVKAWAAMCTLTIAEKVAQARPTSNIYIQL